MKEQKKSLLINVFLLTELHLDDEEKEICCCCCCCPLKHAESFIPYKNTIFPFFYQMKSMMMMMTDPFFSSL